MKKYAKLSLNYHQISSNTHLISSAVLLIHNRLLSLFGKFFYFTDPLECLVVSSYQYTRSSACLVITGLSLLLHKMYSVGTK